MLTGCHDHNHSHAAERLLITVDRAPVATIPESATALLARFDATALEEQMAVHEIRVRTSLPTFGAFITTEEGVVGVSREVDPFTQSDPQQVRKNLKKRVRNLRILPVDGRTALFRMDQIREVRQFSLFFNTLGLDDEVVNFQITHIVVSWRGKGRERDGVRDLQFTLLVTAPPIVLAEAIQPLRVHVSHGAQEILAEMTLTELSNEHSVTVQLVQARLDSPLPTIFYLTDSFGNVLSQGIFDPVDPRAIFFDLGLGGILSIAPGQARRVFVIADLTPFPGLDTLTLEIPRIIVENDNGEVDGIDGPVDPTTRNLVQFVNVF